MLVLQYIVTSKSGQLLLKGQKSTPNVSFIWRFHCISTAPSLPLYCTHLCDLPPSLSHLCDLPPSLYCTHLCDLL